MAGGAWLPRGSGNRGPKAVGGRTLLCAKADGGRTLLCVEAGAAKAAGGRTLLCAAAETAGVAARTAGAAADEDDICPCAALYASRQQR